MTFSLYAHIRREGKKERNVKVALLVSKDCHNELLQLDGLQQLKCILTALRLEVWKSRCHQGFGSLEAPGKNPSCLFQLLRLPAMLPGLWRPTSKSLSPSSHDHLPLCTSVSRFLIPYMGTNHWVRTHSNDLIFIFDYICKDPISKLGHIHRTR